MKNKEPVGIMVFIEGKHARQEYVYKTVAIDDGKNITHLLYGEGDSMYQYNAETNECYQAYWAITDRNTFVNEFDKVDLLGIRWFETEGDKNVVEV